MKILNLYAGIGGNRKLWGNDHDITAVEYDQKIAEIYKDFFPDDNVIVGDAHQYLLDHYKEFDFIWSSPPCPTHSKLGMLGVLSNCQATGNAKREAKYPDMRLYQEIILLQTYFKGKYCVENVIAYYNPLITPQEIQRHHFWANFLIPRIQLSKDNIARGVNSDWEDKFDYDLSKYSGIEKRKVLRNCVHPVLGKHILDYAVNPIRLQGSLI